MERRRLGLERTAGSAEDISYLKRAAKLHTEDRIIRELGGRPFLYASADEREQERKALLKFEAERSRQNLGTSSVASERRRSTYSMIG